MPHLYMLAINNFKSSKKIIESVSKSKSDYQKTCNKDQDNWQCGSSPNFQYYQDAGNDDDDSGYA